MPALAAVARNISIVTEGISKTFFQFANSAIEGENKTRGLKRVIISEI